MPRPVRLKREQTIETSIPGTIESLKVEGWAGLEAFTSFQRCTTPSERSQRRSLVRLENEQILSDFLRTHQFESADEPTVHFSCWVRRRIFPIHVAAKLGDHRVVQALLKAQADPGVKNCWGQTALDVARKANRSGSHKLVMEHLKTPAVNLRQALQIMKTSNST